MSLKEKLKKASRAKQAARPKPVAKKKAAARKPKPAEVEVLSLFAADGSVRPEASWVIAGQGVAHPLGAVEEVLKDVPRTREGLKQFFAGNPLKGILFDGGPGMAVGVLAEDVL